ncbi:MAG TPA: hypothetical protein VM260_18100, partial [Pirellula sp.]|nr:hypothetical protein [Pirellula sp.]
MPRNISSAAAAKLTQATGLEAMNIIRVQWVKGGGYHFYSERNLDENPNIEGKLLSLADLEAVLDINRSTTSTSVRVELNDIDGVIKRIFDNHDINNRPVNIYQWFNESDFSIGQMFLIFEGVIASPITWTEGDRVVSFDVVTKLEDREVGFTVEDGDFDNVPEILLGKSWPLIFGTVLDMPTVQMDAKPTGTTRI